MLNLELFLTSISLQILFSHFQLTESQEAHRCDVCHSWHSWQRRHHVTTDDSCLSFEYLLWYVGLPQHNGDICRDHGWIFFKRMWKENKFLRRKSKFHNFSWPFRPCKTFYGRPSTVYYDLLLRLDLSNLSPKKFSIITPSLFSFISFSKLPFSFKVLEDLYLPLQGLPPHLSGAEFVKVLRSERWEWAGDVLSDRCDVTPDKEFRKRICEHSEWGSVMII